MKSFWILIYIIHPLTTLGTFKTEKSCLEAKSAIAAKNFELTTDKRVVKFISCVKANP